MAAIATLKLDVSKLDKSKIYKGKKGSYYTFSIKIQDQSKFGNNIMIVDDTTKEERDAGVKGIILGNGSVVWTDGNITKAERDDDGGGHAPQATQEDDDLAF